MLGSIRKFSGTIAAKILLGIIIIPFVFWGMGGTIRGGNKNIVVIIDKEKYSIQQFSEFIKRSAVEKVKAEHVEKYLATFIGEKMIEKEIENYGIELSDSSLKKIIMLQKEFKRDNKFSRTEYEKFLIKNNLSAVNFEKLLAKEEKRKQLLDFIGGGISPPNFLVNSAYNKINQTRHIELINLNDAFENQLNFSENEIQKYFEDNKERYSKIYKSFKFLELSPKKLIDSDEYTDLFFKKIDEIDDLIIGGDNIDFIVTKFNLGDIDNFAIDALGNNLNLESKKISLNLVNEIFKLNETQPTVLIELENKYFIVEFVKTENIQKKASDTSVRKEILSDLGRETKSKLTAEIIDKINKKNFNKLDFDKLSKDKNINIKKIVLKNQNDDKVLKKGIISQIYSFAEKRIIIVNDLGLSENYLIFIDKVENATIKNNSDEYEKYLRLARMKMVNDLFNTYDNYLNSKYKIDINYQSLDIVKSYFN